MVMRLPGVAALIMAGQELVVPRWHTRVVNLVTQAHFKPRAIIWELFGDNQLAVAGY